jgi:hypothetical protein
MERRDAVGQRTVGIDRLEAPRDRLGSRVDRPGLALDRAGVRIGDGAGERLLKIGLRQGLHACRAGEAASVERFDQRELQLGEADVGHPEERVEGLQRLL